IIGTPGATFDQVANKGCALSRIEIGKGSAQAMHALDLGTEQVLGHGADLTTQASVGPWFCAGPCRGVAHRRDENGLSRGCHVHPGHPAGTCVACRCTAHLQVWPASHENPYPPEM